MSSNVALYIMIRFLTPLQAKELSFLLAATAKRSGGKVHSLTAFELVRKHNISSDAGLRKWLPDDMKDTTLRHIKARLVKRILQFLAYETEQPALVLHRLRLEGELLLRMGAVQSAVEMLETAIPIARSTGRTHEVLEMTDQLETLQSGLETPDGEKLLPDIISGVETEVNKISLEAEVWSLYRKSKLVKRAFDTRAAAALRKHEAFSSEPDLAPHFISLLHRAAYNLAYTVRDWKGACAALEDLVGMLHPAPLQGLEFLATQLPEYVYMMGVVAMEASDRKRLQNARDLFASPQAHTENASINWIIFRFRLEIAILLRKGDFQNAEREASKIRDAFEQAGLVSQTQYSTEVYSILAAAAFHNGDWAVAAEYSVKYLAKAPGNYLRKLKMFLLRSQCYLHTQQHGKLGICCKEAIAMLGRKNLGAFESVYFSVLSKARKTTTSQDILDLLKPVKQDLLRAIQKPERAMMDSDLKLSEWIKQL